MILTWNLLLNIEVYLHELLNLPCEMFVNNSKISIHEIIILQNRKCSENLSFKWITILEKFKHVQVFNLKEKKNQPLLYSSLNLNFLTFLKKFLRNCQRQKSMNL
jgi:hypothetical protein